MMAYNCACLQSQGIQCLLWPPQTPGIFMVHRHTFRLNTHTQEINKSNLKHFYIIYLQKYSAFLKTVSCTRFLLHLICSPGLHTSSIYIKYRFNLNWLTCSVNSALAGLCIGFNIGLDVGSDAGSVSGSGIWFRHLSGLDISDGSIIGSAVATCLLP